MTERHDGGASGGWDPAHHALRELVMAATVRIHRTGVGYAPEESGAFLGSGFFIAPNWVLTCAHVIHGGEGGEVTVVYQAGPFEEPRAVPGQVAATLPDHLDGPVRGGWPAPDLALVRLREPVDHDCVYVSERPAPHFAEGRVFYAGWTSYQGRPEILDGFLTVRGTIGGWSAGAQMRLGENDLPPGVSGGPVIDPVRGEVVGVLKSRADHGTGGTSIGIERLRMLQVPPDAGAAPDSAPGQPHRPSPQDTHPHDLYQAVFHAHDRYHRDRQQPADSRRPTWADLQSELRARPGRTLSPDERGELLGRLADLPPPVSTRGLLDLLDSLPDFRLPPLSPAPRGWRDGLGVLYETARQDGALRLVLDYAMRVLTAERPPTPSVLDAEQALWDWIKQAATALDSGYRREIARRREEHLGDRRRDRHGRTSADRLTGGAPAERVRAHPRDPAQERSVLLEVVRRGWEPDRCDWSISVARPDGEATRLYEGQRVPLDGLGAHLAAPLAEAFRRCDEPGQPVALQVALPHLLLGMAVDEWRPRPGADPLGAERPVVVRCGDRDQLPAEDDDGYGTYGQRASAPDGADGHRAPSSDEESDRRDRWHRVHAQHAQAEVLDCDDGVRRPVPEAAALRGLAPRTVPVLCRQGDQRYEDDATALGRLARAGYGVVLWRRSRRRPDSVCGEFHRGAKVTVDDGDGAGALPELVHGLRTQVRAGLTEAFWADGIALLYDDPHQPLPGSGDLLEAP
ncbi:VMAP-C domain-containing protein [Streptomyces sp. NPDC004262]